MEKGRSWLWLKLVIMTGLSLWLVVTAMIYSGAERWEYVAYMTACLLCVLVSAGVFFLSFLQRRWLLPLALFCWGFVFVLGEYLPSIKREFIKMSCADIDLVYDEATGECYAQSMSE